MPYRGTYDPSGFDPNDATTWPGGGALSASQWDTALWDIGVWDGGLVYNTDDWWELTGSLTLGGVTGNSGDRIYPSGPRGENWVADPATIVWRIFVYNEETYWWPLEHGERPAFQVQRQSYGSSVGGDYVRGSTVVALPNAVLRYPADPGERRLAVAGNARLHVSPVNYTTMQIEWEWPPEDGYVENWQEFSIVRSSFGLPITVNDGQTILRAHRNAFEDSDGNLTISPVIFDPDLTSGRWYYYTIFFNVSLQAPALGNWVRGYADWGQIPQRFGHDDHLFDGLPPFYRYTDDNLSVGVGPLRKFLSIFGFELDYTRQSIEFVQDMHHVDLSPIPLLRGVARNHGQNIFCGCLGDIRFRAGMANLPTRLKVRGTQKGLLSTVETLSKFPTEVTQSDNMMLLPDDSEPIFSTGNWAGPHADLRSELQANWTAQITADIATWPNVSLTASQTESPVTGEPEGESRLRISSSQSVDLLATCGAGQIDPPVLNHPLSDVATPGVYTPLTSGISVRETGTYAFVCRVRLGALSGQEAKLVLLWMGQSGAPDDVVGVTVGTPPLGGQATDWSADRYSIQDTAPEGAYYLVPAVYITGRTNNDYVDIASMVVYTVTEPGTGGAVSPPNQLMQLGTTGGDDLIGEPVPTDPAPPAGGGPPFQGSFLGSPAQTLSSETDLSSLTPPGVQFFTDEFRYQLQVDENVLDNSTLRLVLFHTAPQESNVDYGSYSTVDELTALAGWREVDATVYPFTTGVSVTSPTVIDGTAYIFFDSFSLTELTEEVEVSAIGIELVDRSTTYVTDLAESYGGSSWMDAIEAGNTQADTTPDPTTVGAIQPGMTVKLLHPEVPSDPPAYLVYTGDSGDTATIDAATLGWPTWPNSYTKTGWKNLVNEPLLMVTDVPFPDGRKTVGPDDTITAYSDPNVADQRWVMRWTDSSVGKTRSGSLAAGPLALSAAAPEFQASHEFNVWMYPQRINFIANPSFSAITNDYWISDGSFTRQQEGSEFVGEFAGATAIESNMFPIVRDDIWTVQMLIKGNGRVAVGLVYYDESYEQPFVDWGTQQWDLNPDSYLHIRATRHVPEGVEGLLRIQSVNDSPLTITIDKVLVEPGALLDWPYFDGDEQYGAEDDFSWYGTQGESYSFWYNNRRSTVSRLFAKPSYDPSLAFTEKEAVKDGLAYNWVPVGTRLNYFLDVLYPYDLQTPPEPPSALTPNIAIPVVVTVSGEIELGTDDDQIEHIP